MASWRDREAWSRTRPLCIWRQAPASSRLLATKIVQVTIEAKMREIITACTTTSAARNMFQTERLWGRIAAGTAEDSPVMAASDCCAKAGRAARRAPNPVDSPARMRRRRPGIAAAGCGKDMLTRMLSLNKSERQADAESAPHPQQR